MPMIPFVGVRSSWLMLGRNSDLAQSDDFGPAPRYYSRSLTRRSFFLFGQKGFVQGVVEIVGAALDQNKENRHQFEGREEEIAAPPGSHHDQADGPGVKPETRRWGQKWARRQLPYRP